MRCVLERVHLKGSGPVFIALCLEISSAWPWASRERCPRPTQGRCVRPWVTLCLSIFACLLWLTDIMKRDHKYGNSSRHLIFNVLSFCFYCYKTERKRQMSKNNKRLEVNINGLIKTVTDLPSIQFGTLLEAGLACCRKRQAYAYTPWTPPFKVDRVRTQLEKMSSRWDWRVLQMGVWIPFY